MPVVNKFVKSLTICFFTIMVIMAAGPSYAQSTSGAGAALSILGILALFAKVLLDIHFWLASITLLFCYWAIAAAIAHTAYVGQGPNRIKSTSRWALCLSSLIVMVSIIPFAILSGWFWLDYILMAVPFFIFMIVSLIAAIGTRNVA